MPNWNMKAMRIQAYDLGTGSGNTTTYTFRPTPSACNVGITMDYAGGPKVTSVSFYPGDIATWFVNPNAVNGTQLQVNSGDMLIKSRSMYWFTLSCLSLTANVTQQLRIPVAPLSECWLPQNVYSIGTVLGGNYFDTTQPIPSSTTRLALDFVTVT